MISWSMVFSLDGAFMEILLVPYAARIQIIFVLNLGRRYVISIAIDVFPPNHTFTLQRNVFRKDTIVKKGPPRRRTSQEIIEDQITGKLVIAMRSLKDMEKSITGLTNVDYDSYHIRRP
jgi:hypothetical protein